MGEDVPEAKRRLKHDLIGLAAFLAVLAGCMIVFVVMGRRYLHFYEYMNFGSLPVPSEMAISLSMTCKHYGILLIVVGGLLAALPVWLARGRAWKFHAAGIAVVLLLTAAEYRGLGVGGRDLRQRFVGSAGGPCGPDIDEFMPTVIAGVQSPVLQSRSEAIRMLGYYGKRASGTAPLLAERLKDQDGEVRLQAAVSLWRITGDAKASLPVLLAGLKDEDPMVQQHAEWAFEALGPAAREALPALRKMLEEDDEWLRKNVAEVIKGIENPDPRFQRPSK